MQNAISPEQGAAPESAPVAAYREAMEHGNYADAALQADALVDIAPAHPDYWAFRAEANYALGQYAAAANDFAQAHNLQPDLPIHLSRFGDALVMSGDRAGGESCYLAALARDPLWLDALLALGELCEWSGRMREASDYILTAVKHHTDSARACHVAGRFMHLYGDRVVASQFFGKAIQNDPTLPEPYRVLANYLRDLDEIPSAIGLYDKLLSIVPDDEIAKAERAHCLAHVNAWDAPGYAAFDPTTPAHMNAACGPWMYLAMEDDPANLLQRCTRYGDRVLANTVAEPLSPPQNDKIRIGYFSADFHEHATMHLLAGVLEAHDKEKFEVYAYSFGPEKDDRMRTRAVAAVDHFTDISTMSDHGVAQLAREHGLDIAIDLKGFTANSRMGIFANRCAPVQVTWLGFPGSTGTTCMDYVIVDPVVTPPGSEVHYSECLLTLPDSYQPNDRNRPLPDPSLTRSDVGLPETGFVFCSFNNVYKLSPAEFDIWMALLREVEGSVLWQLDGGPESQAALRAAASERGVDPARILFAPRVSQGDHISRLALADLFLDTFNCNAHTTASDALWAGVPVVTKAGDQFAARVAASLARAAGTPETICSDVDAYYKMALDLARDPAALFALREKLRHGRDHAPLFDTPRFTRQLEQAFERIASHRT